jgi:hypothetical protein
MAKTITQTKDYLARVTLDALSKFALADLVVDLLRASHGEDLDGEALAAAVIEAFGPVAQARGDRVPKLDAIKRKRDAMRTRRAATSEPKPPPKEPQSDNRPAGSYEADHECG